MSQEPMKEGYGMLSQNQYKNGEKHPDFTGVITVNGKEMRLAMWLKQSQKSGNEYYSLRMTDPDDRPIPQQPHQRGISQYNTGARPNTPQRPQQQPQAAQKNRIVPVGNDDFPPDF